MMSEFVAGLRGMIQRGVLHRVSDAGVAQTVDVETGEGVVRGAAEVLQSPGLACNPGAGGVMALVLAVGGDQGIPVVLLGATSAGLGNLAEGETAIYAMDGSARVHVLPGGEVRILSATKVTIETGSVEIVAAGGVTITGDLAVTGNITATGTITP
jgi:phage gp45-like